MIIYSSLWHGGRPIAVERHDSPRRTRAGRALRAAIAGSLVTLTAARAIAQPPDPPRRADRAAAVAIIAVTLVAGSVVADRSVQAYVTPRRTRTLDALAGDVDPLGRARYLVPALAGTYVVSRLASAERWSHVALHTGVAYAASDAVESILKPAVGRHRPTAANDPGRFHPFSTGAEWHSFPSAHTVHAFSIAAALSAEARRPWVTAAAYGMASAVGLQRVYRDAHWSSDVVGSAILATVTSRFTIRALHAREARGARSPRPDAGAGLRLILLPGGAAFSLSLPNREHGPDEDPRLP